MRNNGGLKFFLIHIFLKNYAQTYEIDGILYKYFKKNVEVYELTKFK